MAGQFRLTVYVGGSADDLPERLVADCEVVIASQVATYWESGIDGVPAMQLGVRVEATTDLDRVPQTLDTIERWFRESEVSTVLVEFSEAFLRRVDRNS